jgi:transposase
MQFVVDGSRTTQTGPDAKKKSLIASEQLRPDVQRQREAFAALAAKLDPQKLVFLDEAGSHIGMTPDYARAPRGERAVDDVPRNRGTVTTMLGALGLAGLLGMMTIEGATDAPVFETFVARILVPNLKPGDIVVLDNLGAHKTLRVRQLVEGAGAKLLFLPPYSPDLNPIEECWSKLKALLKRAAARTREALDSAIATAMNSISPRDARGWFTHAGFSAQAV